MLVREEWPIRGCRPGRHVLPEEESDQAQVTRMANVEIYARRVRAGLPIFREVRDTVISSDSVASAT